VPSQSIDPRWSNEHQFEGFPPIWTQAFGLQDSDSYLDMRMYYGVKDIERPNYWGIFGDMEDNN